MVSQVCRVLISFRRKPSRVKSYLHAEIAGKHQDRLIVRFVLKETVALQVRLLVRHAAVAARSWMAVKAIWTTWNSARTGSPPATDGTGLCDSRCSTSRHSSGTGVLYCHSCLDSGSARLPLVFLPPTACQLTCEDHVSVLPQIS